MTREQAYDESIYPLMAQIIAICKEHSIPLVASFQLDDERPADPALLCTTALVPADAHRDLKAAQRAIQGSTGAFSISTEDQDGNLLSSAVYFP